ncbi:Uncharacterised protein [Serratia rubidaea]|uniref:HTH-type transcriptional regulatory protein gabR n=1 Tax=Serratia rubidaea TaxID=61652 RepID=A0A447QJR0_SERRU|nr:Uncharacterised protein [Serratia rubidaea]
MAPAGLVSLFRDSVNHLPGPGSMLPQAMVADFMAQGHFGRHLRKMRALYAARRGYLVDALQQTLGERLHIQPQAGGIHVLAHLPAGQDDKALAIAAGADGLSLQALSDWRAAPAATGGLLMGFANFATAEEATAAVQRLKAVMA